MAFAPNFFAAVRNCPGTDQKLTGLAGEINVDAVEADADDDDGTLSQGRAKKGIYKK